MATAKSNLCYVTMTREATMHGSTTGETYIPALQEVPNTENIKVEAIQDTTIKTSVYDGGIAPTTGRKRGEFEVSVNLSGLGTNTGSSLTKDNDSEILDYIIGPALKLSGWSGTTCSAGWTVNGGDVASASGLEEGMIVLIGGKAAIIEDITGNTITLASPLPSAPSAGTIVYASFTHAPTSSRSTWKVEIHKDASKVAYACSGVSFTPSLEGLGAADDKVKMKLKASIGDFSYIDSTIDTPSAINAFEKSAAVQNGGWFYLGDASGNKIQCIVSGFSVNNLITETRRQDACQPNAIGTPEYTSEERTIELTLWQGKTEADPIVQLRSWFNSGTMLELLYQIGREPGDCVALYFPAVYLMEEPKETDVGGLMAIKCQLKISINKNSSVFNKHFYLARI